MQVRGLCQCGWLRREGYRKRSRHGRVAGRGDGAGTGTGTDAPCREEDDDESGEDGNEDAFFHWEFLLGLGLLLGGFAGKEGFGVLFEVVEEEAEGTGGVAEVFEEGG